MPLTSRTKSIAGIKVLDERDNLFLAPKAFVPFYVPESQIKTFKEVFLDRLAEELAVDTIARFPGISSAFFYVPVSNSKWKGPPRGADDILVIVAVDEEDKMPLGFCFEWKKHKNSTLAHCRMLQVIEEEEEPEFTFGYFSTAV